jgi:hypothetical protein
MSEAPTSRAVVERRHSAADALDYFPTPPWATRALMEVLDDHYVVGWGTVWEPACGCGHMADVLAERFRTVHASDVADYGHGLVGSFVGTGGLDLDVAPVPEGGVDWIVTNPPFNLAEAFLDRALDVARGGVALLLRSAWIDGQGRFERIFGPRRPQLMLQFSERVPMVEGRWDPAATTAAAYAWFVWRQGPQPRARRICELLWIPPGMQARLTRPDDVARFAGRMPKGVA